MDEWRRPGGGRLFRFRPGHPDNADSEPNHIVILTLTEAERGAVGGCVVKPREYSVTCEFEPNPSPLSYAQAIKWIRHRCSLSDAPMTTLGRRYMYLDHDHVGQPPESIRVEKSATKQNKNRPRIHPSHNAHTIHPIPSHPTLPRPPP